MRLVRLTDGSNGLDCGSSAALLVSGSDRGEL